MCHWWKVLSTSLSHKQLHNAIMSTAPCTYFPGAAPSLPFSQLPLLMGMGTSGPIHWWLSCSSGFSSCFYYCSMFRYFKGGQSGGVYLTEGGTTVLGKEPQPMPCSRWRARMPRIWQRHLCARTGHVKCLNLAFRFPFLHAVIRVKIWIQSATDTLASPHRNPRFSSF